MLQSTFNGRKPVLLSIQPNIGLDASARQSIVEMLNLLLADEAVLALKTSRMVEQTGSAEFPKRKTFYDTQYLQIRAISNEIIERIQILGGLPLTISEKHITSTRLEEQSDPGFVGLLADHEAFIRYLREDAQKCSEVFEDQGTFAMLVSLMRTHEKMAWLLRSNIAPEHRNYEK